MTAHAESHMPGWPVLPRASVVDQQLLVGPAQLTPNIACEDPVAMPSEIAARMPLAIVARAA